MAGSKVVVYGLSTEGYAIASQMAMKGADVFIIDESNPSAISLKAEIAKIRITSYNVCYTKLLRSNDKNNISTILLVLIGKQSPLALPLTTLPINTSILNLA